MFTAIYAIHVIEIPLRTLSHARTALRFGSKLGSFTFRIALVDLVKMIRRRLLALARSNLGHGLDLNPDHSFQSRKPRLNSLKLSTCYIARTAPRFFSFDSSEHLVTSFALNRQRLRQPTGPRNRRLIRSRRLPRRFIRRMPQTQTPRSWRIRFPMPRTQP